MRLKGEKFKLFSFISFSFSLSLNVTSVITQRSNVMIQVSETRKPWWLTWRIWVSKSRAKLRFHDQSTLIQFPFSYT